MIQLEDDFLEKIGYPNASDEDRATLMHQAEETLNKRIGMALGAELTDEQLDSVDDTTQLSDDWLRENIPNYEEIAQRELDAYTQELKSEMAKIDDIVAKASAEAEQDQKSDS